MVWFTHVEGVLLSVCMMKKRSRGREEGMEEDTLGIGGVGGFVDTVGATKRKRGRRESLEGENPASENPVTRDTMKDELEERLEEILFGTKPFNPVLPSVAEVLDTDSEAEEEEVGLWGVVSEGVWHSMTRSLGHYELGCGCVWGVAVCCMNMPCISLLVTWGYHNPGEYESCLIVTIE